MLRLILLYRLFLPQFVWKYLWKNHWREYWHEQARLAAKRAGREIPTPLPGSEIAAFTEAVAYCAPFSSVLEVGCGSGDNILRLAKIFRWTKFVGVDSNIESIQKGQHVLKQLKLKNVRLLAEHPWNLTDFDSNSFDLAVSCAYLLTVGPEHILETLKEMQRLSKKQIVLLEQHQEGAQCEQSGTGLFKIRPFEHRGYWIWDYQELCNQLSPPRNPIFTKIPHPQWGTDEWKSLGRVITFRP